MTIIRNILAVLLGLVIGSSVNMGLITLGNALIPLPAGADVSTIEKLAESMPLFGPEQFLFPFLAHALGTLVGALVAYLIAREHRQSVAYIVGAAFFIGGALNVYMLPAPPWFSTIDLLFAYAPMALLACKLAGHFAKVPVTHG
jgi:hypothetical protein